jgi:hypothetical protein
MTYVVAADFRPGSGKWYTHGIPLTEDDADSNALSDAITAMSEAIDLYTRDHFEPEPGDGPPEGTITIDMSGNGGAAIELPKRIRSITEVALRDRDGVLTVQEPSVYRYTQSLIEGGTLVDHDHDLDQIALIPGQHLTGTGWWGDSMYPGIWHTWPIGPQTIQVTGQFSFATTPEQIKRAVALMVYDAIKPSSDVLHRSERWATPTASVIRAPADPTGLPEVDGIISQFTRDRIPAI